MEDKVPENTKMNKSEAVQIGQHLMSNISVKESPDISQDSTNAQVNQSLSSFPNTDAEFAAYILGISPAVSNFCANNEMENKQPSSSRLSRFFGNAQDHFKCYHSFSSLDP